MKPTPLQWGILAATATLGIVLLFSFRRVPRAAKEAVPRVGSVSAPAGAGQPTTVLSGFDYAQTSAGKPKFQIHADRTVGFAQGAGLPSTWYSLEAVSLTLFSEQGQPYEVRSERADYDPRTKAVHLKGRVVLKDRSGMNVTTDAVAYDPASNRLNAPGPVGLARGPVRGRAASAVYDAGSGELAMAGPVEAEQAGVPPTSLRSDRGLYRRAQSEIDLSGHVEGVRGSDRFASESLRLHVAGDDRIDTATAEGGVTGTVATSPGEAPQSFSGSSAKLDFDPAGKLDRVVLSGSPAAIESIESAPAAIRRRIEAPAVTMEYEADRLRRAKADGGARITRAGRSAAGEPVRDTIQSSRAEARFSPDGALAKAEFSGDVVATSTTSSGRAPRAEFDSSEDRLTLLAEGTRDAEVAAERGKVVARRIDIFSGVSRLSAFDSARAFLKPTQENRGLPQFLSSSKKPTRAKADRIDLDEHAKTATFSGAAALWQDANALFADRIELRDVDRTAIARGRVRAISRTSEPPGPRAPALSTVSADRMRYQERDRTARFEGGVRATRGSQSADGDVADSVFDARNQVERTVLSGHVRFSDPATGRRGSGDRAEDEPPRGLTTLFGDPALAEDAQGNRVSAATLTFRKDSGSVEAKAKDGSKIEAIYQTHGSSRGQTHRRTN